MTGLPTGTVTFLFADIEGSTTLLREVGSERYAIELDSFRDILRAACGASGGVEVDRQGDSVFAVFARAADAAEAALRAQEAYAATMLRVRMGLHTGEPLLTASGYVGFDVHRAARIGAAANGGQVLLSQTTRELLGAEADLLDLGRHRLKDLPRAERLYQLGRGEYPPPRALHRNSLPVPGSRLVGRVGEQEQLVALLHEARLVTVTGTGGVGKTRLALEVAATLEEEWADGVFFVSLAALRDSGLVLSAIEQAVGRPDRALRDAHALVLLDNFEHLAGAAVAVGSLLAEAPGLTLLVTSRAPLRLTAEHEYPLQPLSQDAAVELFLERARVDGRPLLADTTVAGICNRLDRLPLALELAVARLRLFDSAALLARLDERLPLLTGGPRDLPERQRTLEATIAWSYDLLSEAAGALFERLSIFAGTFGISAAETVAGAQLEPLAQLVDASLLRPLGGSRLVFLETVREFARKRLDEPTAQWLAREHATYYVELADQAAPQLTGPDAALWLARLEDDHGNLRAALDWLIDADPRAATLLTTRLWRFWFIRGSFLEAQSYLERALALNPPEDLRGELLYQLGAIVSSRGETERSSRLFSQALVRFRAAADRSGEARALAALGHAASDAGEWTEARRFYERAAHLWRGLADDLGLAGILGDLATLDLRSGRPAEALLSAQESAELQRRIGNAQGEALALATAGYARLGAGDPYRGRELLVESTEICHRLGYLHGLVFCLNGLGLAAATTDSPQDAAEAFWAAACLRHQIGIEHDPDDALVAVARATTARQTGRQLEAAQTDRAQFDVDSAVAGCLATASAKLTA